VVQGVVVMELVEMLRAIILEPLMALLILVVVVVEWVITRLLKVLGATVVQAL
jgi:hypothetical protein